MVIDTHCHLSASAFDDPRSAVRAAHAQGVWGVVAVGSDPAANARTLTIAEAQSKSVWACLGFHPDRPELGDPELDAVEAQIAQHHARVVALGEIGLPWYSLEGVADAAGVMSRARVRLARLLMLAARYDLAVSLHAPHGAAAGALDALKRSGVERAVFHWHKAPADVTRAIVDAGYLVSVTPEVVYRDRDRELVELVPIGSLVVESDAPWRYGGEFAALASGPWLAARVAEEVAKIKGMPVDDTVYVLSTNASRVFELQWV